MKQDKYFKFKSLIDKVRLTLQWVGDLEGGEMIECNRDGEYNRKRISFASKTTPKELIIISTTINHFLEEIGSKRRVRYNFNDGIETKVFN